MSKRWETWCYETQQQLAHSAANTFKTRAFARMTSAATHCCQVMYDVIKCQLSNDVRGRWKYAQAVSENNECNAAWVGQYCNNRIAATDVVPE